MTSSNASKEIFWEGYRLVILLAVCYALILITLHFLYFVPEYQKIDQQIANDKTKKIVEYDKLVSMDCKQLGEYLLHDDWYARDNLIWAQNHYSVNCK